MSKKIWFNPLVSMEKLPDGTWRMEFDWESSCDGEFLDDHSGETTWTDRAQEASDVLDRYCASANLNSHGVVIIEEEPV